MSAETLLQQLRAQAQQYRDEAAALRQRADGLDAEAAAVDVVADGLERRASGGESTAQPNSLTRPNTAGTFGGMSRTTQAARVHISQAKGKQSKLAVALATVGHTIRSAAPIVANHPKIRGTGLGCSYGTLSAASRRAKRSSEQATINRVVAEVVEELTQGAFTVGDWPSVSE